MAANRSLTLIELVVAHFLAELEQLTRMGLAKSYREEQANLRIARGRLLFTEHTRANHARNDRCYVRFTSYDRDIRVNRLLRTALAVTTQSPVSSGLRARAHACLPWFEGVTELPARPRLFEGLVFNRSTDRYRKALALGAMLVEGLLPALRIGAIPVFSLLFDINVLWERYVAALFQAARTEDVTVATQTDLGFFQPEEAQARLLRPDILIRHARESRILAVVDTKWKVLEDSAPAMDDLQQMFAYNEMSRAPAALLVYPSTCRAGYRWRGAFVDRTHSCAVFEFDITLCKRFDVAREAARALIADVVRTSSICTRTTADA